ncbi:MAG TPA: hypothetical protein PLL39_01515, partial [Rhodocyclaceae bacterium]|nr:hypothetical protein [Rhodocyclaceae bacterium]
VVATQGKTSVLRFVADKDPNIIALDTLKATQLGFSGDETSVLVADLLASKAADTAIVNNGIPPGSVSSTFELVLKDGGTVSLPVSLSFLTLEGNTSLANLAADLQSALATALGNAGLQNNLLSVGVHSANGLDSLSITAADDRVSLVRLTSGGMGAFSVGQESVQSGARLYFSAYNSAHGYELWVSDGTAEGTRMLEGAAGTASVDPYYLTPVGGVLYFVGYNSGAGYYSLWRHAGGNAPELLSGQSGFRNPSYLVNADGRLVFAAQVSATYGDEEVFSYNGVSFTQLTNIPSNGSNPTDLTWFNGKVLFAGQDAPDGAVTQTGLVGRELWQVGLDSPYNPSVLANVNTQDVNPTTTTTWVIVGYQQIGHIRVPIFQQQITTTPGSVKGSNPYYLTPAGDSLYFSANDGASGRELWRTDGVTTQRVADLTAGSGGSSPYELTAVQTAAGQRMFFVSGGALYVTDGSEANTHAVANTENVNPYGLTALGDKLFFYAQGKLWVATEAGATRFDALIPPPLPLTVSVLAGEGDDTPSDADRMADAAFSETKAVNGGVAEFDLTAAVRAALARGETRLTVRVENIAGDEDLDILLAGLGKSGKTGLEVVPRERGLVADLYTEEGQLVASGKSIIDMRNLEAGGFYLRVYNPDGPVAEDLDFEIAIDAPSQGYSHPESDRDRIHGGEGEDILVGNDSIDRLWGESGRDRFVAENFEVRDLDFGEKIEPVAESERSDILPRQTDALIGINDEKLRIALARALGYAVTERYDSTEGNRKYVIHVPHGSERTDISLPNASEPAWSQRIWASSMAELSELDASNLGITNLTGLKYAINLITLNLAGNDLADSYQYVSDEIGWTWVSPLQELKPGTSDSGDTVGFPYGTLELRNLAIDFNPGLFELAPLQQLLNLERLSFDGAAMTRQNYYDNYALASLNAGESDVPVDPETILGQIAMLTWPVADPTAPERGLTLLSLDNYTSGLNVYSGTGYTYGYGYFYAGEEGDYRFTVDDSSYGYVYVGGMQAFYDAGTSPHSVTPVHLAKGWHYIDFNVNVSDSPLRYDPPSGPAQVVPDAVLRPYSGTQGRIEDLSQLTHQADLQYLSLRSHVISDVRPLAQLEELRVLGLQDNFISNIEDLTGQRLVDDGDESFTLLGDWAANLSEFDGAFEGDYRFREGVTDANAAKWTFGDLDIGRYEVLVSWPAADSRTETAKYFVRGTNTAEVKDLGQNLFNAVSGDADPAPLAGTRTVTINTDTLNISGDDGNVGTFYGTPFMVGYDAGLMTVYVLGDLHIGGDVINVVGSRALSIQAGDDVYIDANAEFNLAAQGADAGPGGGDGGNGGNGGAGGAGGVNGQVFLPSGIIFNGVQLYFWTSVGGTPGAGGAGGDGGGNGFSWLFGDRGDAGAAGGASGAGVAGSSGSLGASGGYGEGGYNNPWGYGYGGYLGIGAGGGAGGAGRAGGGGGASGGGNGGNGSSAGGQAGGAGYTGFVGGAGYNFGYGLDISGGAGGGG